MLLGRLNHQAVIIRSSYIKSETARWANGHRADTARILMPFTGIDAATFASMERSTFADTLSRDLLQPPIDVAYKYGQLKAPLDAKQIVSDAEPYRRGIR